MSALYALICQSCAHFMPVFFTAVKHFELQLLYERCYTNKVYYYYYYLLTACQYLSLPFHDDSCHGTYKLLNHVATLFFRCNFEEVIIFFNKVEIVRKGKKPVS